MRRTKLVRYRTPLIGDAVDGGPSGWFPYTNGALLGVIVALLLSGVAFAVAVSSYVSDGNAREDVQMVQNAFDVANDVYLSLRSLGEEATRQKDLVDQLEPIVTQLKENVTDTAQAVNETDTQATVDLYAQINQTIEEINADFNTQIDSLQIQLSVLLSQSNIASTLQRSGTCIVQSENNTVIDYEYRLSDFASLILPFYLFKEQDDLVDLGNTGGGFQIGPCAPPILDHIGTVSAPLVAQQLSTRLVGDPMLPSNFFSDVTGGNGNIVFARSTQYVNVSQSVRIGPDGMTFWVSLM